MIPQYAVMLPTLRMVARHHGYALGLHGSGERDLDLIAVPWVEGVSSAEELIRALAQAVDGMVPRGRPGRDPMLKPHGRLAYSIILDWPLYLDISVMPLIAGP